MFDKQLNKSKYLAFTLGFMSMVGQVLLLRELITVFYGNEIAYAVILSCWLFWIAVGSFAVSCFINRIRNVESTIGFFLFLNFFILPSLIIFTRSVKQIMDIPIGQIIGVVPMIIASFLLLAPLTLLLGGLFTLICRFSEGKGQEKVLVEDISYVYQWEAIGSAIGGCLFSFVFVHIFSAMTLALLTGAMNLIVIILFCGVKFLRKLAIGMICLVAGLFLSGAVKRIDDLSRSFQWKGHEIVTVTDSIYGNVTLTKRGGEYSLFENGLHSFTTHDILSSEENIHYALLAHPAPKRVLLIGGGVGGGLMETLKYREVNIDYVELDPKVVAVSKQYLPEDVTAPLRNSRVKVHYMDARFFVKRSLKEYDVVIVGLSDPYTALLNRYFSLEFFEEVNKILSPGGIISFGVSSSENYLNKEARAFLRSINTTLKMVFVDVKSIPGDTNIFLASNKSGVISLDPGVFTQRLQSRGIATTFVREYYLPFKLSADRISYINDVLKEQGKVNTDIHPIAYLYDVILWSTHFNTSFKNLFEKMQGLKFWHLMIVPLLIFAGGWFSKRFSSSSPVTLSIMVTGFSEIIFQIIVIIAFQTLYGYAYYKIGLILASFMAGLVGGSFSARKIIECRKSEVLRIYKFSQLAICIYPLILPFVFVVFRNMIGNAQQTAIFATAFSVLPIIAGFLGGVQYPLATYLVGSMKSKGEEKTVKTAGFLYAVDVLGATIGALLAGTVLIPLLGINAVAYFCVALNIAVLGLLLGMRSS